MLVLHILMTCKNSMKIVWIKSSYRSQQYLSKGLLEENTLITWHFSTLPCVSHLQDAHTRLPKFNETLNNKQHKSVYYLNNVCVSVSVCMYVCWSCEQRQWHLSGGLWVGLGGCWRGQYWISTWQHSPGDCVSVRVRVRRDERLKIVTHKQV